MRSFAIRTEVRRSPGMKLAMLILLASLLAVSCFQEESNSRIRKLYMRSSERRLLDTGRG